MTDPELLRETASALYGERWQNELARALDVNDRTVRRWAAATASIPPGIWGAIDLLMIERAARLQVLRSRLRPRLG